MRDTTKDIMMAWGGAIITGLLVLLAIVLVTGWLKARAIKNLTGKDVSILDASQVTLSSDSITNNPAK